MNFTFTITAHGFEKAATIEKALKAIDVPYHTAMSKPIGNKRTRVVIDKLKLAIVVTSINDNPGASDKEIARMTGVGENTVNRIRNGKHALQTKGNIVSMKKSK